MAEARDPAAPASTGNTFEEFYRLRNKVMDQKKKKQVKSRDLLKLAGLTAQCHQNSDLPVCVLCQDTTKKINQLGHYFPHSILKEAGQTEFCNLCLGTSGQVSRMGFRAFCQDCEKRFCWGETHLNPKFYKPFLKDDSVKDVECLDSGFPWLFFAMASVIWRCMCFSKNSDKVFEAWEDIRKVLLNYKKNEGTGIVEVDEDVTNNIEKTLKLYLISPNHEIDQKLKGAPEKDIYFYKTFHAFFNLPENHLKKKVINGCALMGPLHIAFVYSKSQEILESKKFNECFGFDQLDKHSRLTAKTGHFTIEGKELRYYPAFFFEGLCIKGAELLSQCLRAPSQEKPVEGKVEEGQCLSILPQGVSYDNRGNKFNYPTKIYKHCKSFNRDQTPFYHIEKVVRGKKEILFVADPRGLMNGGYVAQALTFPDKKLGYLEGLPTESMKQRVVSSVDLTTPPFLEEIRIVCDKFHVFDTHGESCPLKKS